MPGISENDMIEDNAYNIWVNSTKQIVGMHLGYSYYLCRIHSGCKHWGIWVLCMWVRER